MRKFFSSSLLGLGMALSACTGESLQSYDNTTPAISFRDYFDGPLQAQGIVQNRKGEVIRRFVIDMQGSWSGENGTLDESFRYDDGKTERRVWSIRQLGPNKFEGTAADIIGTAHGNSNGFALKWQYTMAIPVDGTTYHIHFDDWMYLQEDGKTIINRAHMSKFGFNVGEVTVVMRKL